MAKRTSTIINKILDLLSSLKSRVDIPKIEYKGILTSSDNIDNVFKSGFYYIKDSIPNGTGTNQFSSWSYLIIITDEYDSTAVVTQMYIHQYNNKFLIRRYWGNPLHWESWKALLWTSSQGTTSYYNVADYIIERGTDSTWTWEKWLSGKAVCWGTLTQETTSWTSWGTVYEGKPAVQGTYPSGLFNSTPKVQATADGSAGGILSVETYNGASSTKTPQLFATRPNNPGSNLKVPIYVLAIGTWK